MSAIIDYYNYIFVDLRDPRVDNWPFMSSPLYPLTVIAIYLVAIYIALPSYMINKRPFNLKKVIAIYNVFQVVACTILIYGVATSGWTTTYTLGCHAGDFSDDKMAVRMAKYVWATGFLKFIELIETVFFILRKKYNQVSPLHVYHHASTFAIAWLGTKFYPGGMLTFNIILNSFIHILMYTYYLLTLLGPKMQKRLEPIKPQLTILQMIQLCILLVHMAQILLPGCNVPIIAPIIYIPNILINLYFFANFYFENYIKRKTA